MGYYVTQTVINSQYARSLDVTLMQLISYYLQYFLGVVLDIILTLLLVRRGESWNLKHIISTSYHIALGEF